MSIKINKYPDYKEYFYFGGVNTCYCPSVNFHVPISDAKDFLAKIRRSFDVEDNFLIQLSKEIGLSIQEIKIERVNPFFSLKFKGIKEEKESIEVRFKVLYQNDDANRLIIHRTITEKCAEFIENQWAEFVQNNYN